jgi:hypothetical protein
MKHLKLSIKVYSEAVSFQLVSFFTKINFKMGCNHVDWINMAQDTGSMSGCCEYGSCPPGP